MHFTKKFQKVMRAVEALAETEGGITDAVRTLFREECLKLGHEERIRNLYRVKDKLSSEAVFFVPSKSQAKYLKTRTGRDIILKTRQLGFTTLEAVREYDLAIWTPNFAAGIMAHQQDAVKKIFDNTVKFTHSWFKKDWGHFYSPVEKSDSSTSLGFENDGLGRDLQSRIDVAFNFRSGTLQKLHVSEAAFISDDRLRGSLQCVPITGEITYESTPNGRGGDFYNQWQHYKTQGSLAPYKGHFFPWYECYPENPEDEKWVLPPDVNLSPLEQQLLADGLKPYHIAWRRWCIMALCQNSEETFENEYPTNDIDCFFTGEAQVFGREILKSQSKHCRPANSLGFLLLDGPRVVLHEDVKGTNFQWEAPEVGTEYAIGADPSAGVGKDRAVAYVLNRKTGAIVAKSEGQFEPTDFADELYKLGTYYNRAWICVEENNHGHTVIQRLKSRNYTNLYKRRVIDEQTNKPTKKIGFLTTNESKLQVTEQFKAQLKSGAVKFHDNDLIDEMSTFIQVATKTGSGIRRCAQEGKHDDRVMAACFTVEMHLSRGVSVDDLPGPSTNFQIDEETGFAIYG